MSFRLDMTLFFFLFLDINLSCEYSWCNILSPCARLISWPFLTTWSNKGGLPLSEFLGMYHCDQRTQHIWTSQRAYSWLAHDILACGQRFQDFVNHKSQFKPRQMITVSIVVNTRTIQTLRRIQPQTYDQMHFIWRGSGSHCPGAITPPVSARPRCTKRVT